MFQPIRALYLALFDDWTFSHFFYFITWPWLHFSFLTIDIRFLFHPYWSCLLNTCLFLRVTLRYLRVIPFAKLYQKLPRSLYLLCPVITPILVIESINVLNSLIKNDQYLSNIFTLIDLSLSKDNKLLYLLLDKGNELQPHFKFEVEERFFLLEPLLLLFEHLLIINKVNQKIRLIISSTASSSVSQRLLCLKVDGCALLTSRDSLFLLFQ